MLTTEEIFTLAEPFGAFQYGDAQGDKRIAFARAVERAAYEAAIKACRGEMVDAVATESREDESYNMAIDHCADAIRSLIQEQPK